MTELLGSKSGASATEPGSSEGAVPERASSARSASAAKGRKGVQAVYELTPLQQGMFFHSRYSQEPAVYLTQFHCALEGVLDLAAFELAWNRVLQRHDVLRTTFHWRKLDKPLQVVRHKATLRPLVIDLRRLSSARQEQEIAVQQETDRRRGVDLERVPLMRVLLLQTGPRQRRMLWSHHHLLLDGWSVHRVLQELFAFYASHRLGQPLELERPRPFRDFVLWLQQHNQADAAKSYFAQLLAGIGEASRIDLPRASDLLVADSRTPAVDEDYTRFFRPFDSWLSGSLKQMARRQRVTLNTLFQAAWGYLLALYSRRQEVVFGATTAGRPPGLSGVESMIGLFINTLPVRVGKPGRGSEGLASWLRGLQEQQARSRRFEHTPLAQIQSWSEVERGKALFSTLLVFENLPSERLAPASTGLDLEVRDAGFVQRTNYDLTLAVSPRGSELSVRLAFQPARFERTAAGRLLVQLESLLRSLLLALGSDPTSRLGGQTGLSALDRASREQVLRQWNDRCAGPFQETTVAHLFARQVRRRPEATALIVAESAGEQGGQWRELSYAQLYAAAQRVAAHLVNLGLGRTDRIVGVACDRSLEMLAAVLGVHQAGCAYLPLDPSYPAERIEHMLADASLDCVITQERHRKRFIARSSSTSKPEGSGNGFRLLEVEELLGAEPEVATDTPANARPSAPALAQPLAQPGGLAYLIYTSGSTGRPKGVMVEHRTLARRVWAMQQRFHLGPEDRQLQFVSLSFDVSCEEIFAPLAHGAALVLDPAVQGLSPGEILDLVADRQVTKMNLPASFWHQLVDHLEATDSQVPPSLRMLGTGAEAPMVDKLRQWLRRAPQESRVFNIYGPTEGTILCTIEDVTGLAHRPLSRLPLGRPVEDARLYVVDRQLQCSAPGVAGELMIGGPGLARGYLRRPGLTAERFLPDPFADQPDARLYRTGDLVRHRPDGRLEFLGRVDHQVKVRGFRVELGEIETALASHPQVSQAVVLHRDDGEGHRLVAYLVLEPEVEQLGVEELRGYLGQRLPEAMVPARYLFLTELPLGPNNKVDRRALPAPDAQRPELIVSYRPPQGALESYLTELWQEILSVERVGTRDGFFDLGGDSLKGAVLINRLEARLGHHVYVVALFDAPTVQGFARYLAGHCPQEVADCFGEASLQRALRSGPATIDREARGVEDPAPDPSAHRLGEEHLAWVRRRIEPLPLRPSEARRSVRPRALFILSPPRSGSTLLRVMLAGHPSLFAPPELDLLSFNTMAERAEAFSGRYGFWREGLLRALMEIEGVEADGARSLTEPWERGALPVCEVYAWMQERLGQRLLVDKTPAYALDLEILQRMEADFFEPVYVHLLRHPGGMIRSFEKARIDELFFRPEHPYSPRQLAELVWDLSHQNILSFLRGVPAERQLRLSFEQLVADPAGEMGRLCEFLDLELEPRMLQPYGDLDGRMTDGIHPLAKMLGDVKFHQHREVDSKVAWRWLEAFPQDFLGVPTWELAHSLGYQRPQAWARQEGSGLGGPQRDKQERASQPANAARPIPGRGPALDQTWPQSFPLSLAQQRLWVVHRLQPTSGGYNLPLAVRLSGPLRPACLVGALTALQHRHESLRTTFAEQDGAPRQVVAAPGASSLLQVDLLALPQSQASAEADRLLRREAERPFDLRLGPLLRALLLRTGKEQHRLLLVTHHIVSDGWSQGILMRELVQAYAQLSTSMELGKRPRWKPAALDVQYGDFALWQRRELGDEQLGAQLQYWTEALGSAPCLLEMPTDRPRPAMPSFRGRRLPLRLGTETSDALQALAGRASSTPFMVILALWALFLSRHAAQSTVVVGSAFSRRPRQELEGLIGFFVNTLPLPVRLQQDKDLHALLAQVRQSVLGAFQNADLPFERLVEALVEDRSTSHQPLFQAALTLSGSGVETGSGDAAQMEEPSSSGARVGNLHIEPEHVSSTSAKFDLTLSLGFEDSGLGGSLEYRTDLWDEVSAQRMGWRLVYLVESAIRQPHESVQALSLMPVAEQLEVMAWSKVQQRYPQPAPALQRFLDQARQAPDAVALHFGTEQLSYAALEKATAAVAMVLRRRGVGPEVRVAVLLPPGCELVVALLAVMRAGGGQVPLDLSYPARRLQFILRDSGAKLLITSQEVEPATEVQGLPPRLSIGRILRSAWSDSSDAAENAGATRSETPQPRDLDSAGLEPDQQDLDQQDLDQLAYVIYTSGSSGQPKGTPVAHRQLARLLEAAQADFDFGPLDRWTLCHSAAFDFSVWEMWGALAFGGRLSLVPLEVRQQPAALAGLLQQQRITVLNQTPNAFRQLSSAMDLRGRARVPLRWVIFGGEALDLASVHDWLEPERPHTAAGWAPPQLVNMYGITETTVHVTFRTLRHADLQQAWRSLIGRPLADLQVLVLDRQGRPVPPGVAGELHVAGDGLARGYLGRPGLTAQRFIPHAWAEQPGARLYRSGDLGRWLPVDAGQRGELEYLGRADHQVKVRGFRVELGEIEAALEQHSRVHRAVALTHEGDSNAGARRLISWVVPERAASPSLHRLLQLQDEGELEGRHLYDLSNGWTVVALNRLETEFLDREIFDQNSYLRHDVGPRSGEVVLDVGANIGLFSLQAAALGARVVACEPMPDVHEALALNFRIHGLDGQALPLALAREPGQARFRYVPGATVLSRRSDMDNTGVQATDQLLQQRLQQPALGDTDASAGELHTLLQERLAEQEVSCEQSTVSAVMRQQSLSRIDLLKVDVEGGEEEVLAGIETADWPRIQRLVVEVHDLEGRLQRMRDQLEERGYRVLAEQDSALRGTQLHSLYAWRPGSRQQGTAESPEPGWLSARQLERELRAELRQHLPEHMVPSHVVPLLGLPLTAHGKLDRRALLKQFRESDAHESLVAESAPLDELEQTVARVFSQLLERQVNGHGDDFFDLGGHSLLAVRLVAELKEACGRELALSDLFRASTVAAVADALRGPMVEAQLPLVQLQVAPTQQMPSAPPRPLLCVHPAGGNVLCYLALARKLGTEQPVWGLEAPGLRPARGRATPENDMVLASETVLDRVEDMAAHYLEAIASQPTAPSPILLGWSLGGLVAWDMACRLERQGKPPHLLVLVDVLARQQSRNDALDPAEGVIEALQAAAGWPEEALQGLEGEARLQRALELGHAAGVVPAGFDRQDAQRYLQVFAAGQRAATAYQPGPYCGEVLLLRASDAPAAVRASRDMGWSSLALGTLHQQVLTGTHQSLLQEPALSQVCALLEPRLRDGRHRDQSSRREQ